ncbi:MAG: hypothetical protein JWL71_889 [Acidobacteria bacterium]|nr:hypothetical protein [Acidobacteriota bacterium]
MRRVPLALGLLAALAGPLWVDAAQRAAPRSGLPLPRIELVARPRIDGVESWLKAVARHIPGDNDEALEQVAAWPNASLEALWFDADVLAGMIRGGAKTNGRGATSYGVRGEGPKRPTQTGYSTSELRRMNVLACAAGGMLVDPPCMAIDAAGDLDPELRQVAALARASKLRGDDNYIMRRGAILHADVAMLAPLSMNVAGAIRPAAGLERLRMEISDGRGVDLRQSAVHWEIARMLLDFVQPRGRDRADPGRDEMVRQWYRATASWMQRHEAHDKLHLDRARALFPSDPDILFLSGCQRETYAAPPIQAAVRSAVLPTGVIFGVASERDELRQADALFRRLLDIKPDHGEGRLRHGRVLGALGRHGEAAVELRRAIPDLADDQLLYYAEMFLGAADEALGNRDAARVAYEQAAKLFSRAQSPLLALSQLARGDGDRGGALRAIARLFALPDEARGEHDDPWWSYYVAQARDADDLIAAMQRPYLAERLP